MSLRKENYKERLIDEKISKYLKVFGAISMKVQSGVEKHGLV